MDGFLRGIDIIGEGSLGSFLLEADLVGVGVIGDFDGVSGGVLEGLILAIELHLVPVPGVSIRTDEVVAVIGIGIAKIEVDSLNGIKMRNSNPNPGCQLLDFYLPSLHATTYYYYSQMYFPGVARAASFAGSRGSSYSRAWGN